MKVSKKTILILLTIVLGSVFDSCQENDKQLRLATYTYSTNNRIENLKPLAQGLEKLLNRKVQVVSYPDVASFIEGIKSNQVDIGLINTLGYLSLSLENNIMEPIAALKVRENAVNNYKTVLLTNNDSINDLASLKKNANHLSMMFVNKGSTSGNLVPRLLLSSLGIKSPENQFKKVTYGEDHHSTFSKLLSGQSDICVLGSNEYFKKIHQDSTFLGRTKVLWISEEIPLGPVLLNKNLSKVQREMILEFVLKLHEENKNILESIKEGWSEAKQAERFYAISDNHYDNFRAVNGNHTDLEAILKMFQE